jgi:hypothetical protein
VLDDLVTQALVGTGRTPPALPKADGPLGEALNLARDDSAEAKLLSAGAVVSRYETCGRVPLSPGGPSLAPAPDDARAACSPRAAELLAAILLMTNTPAKQALSLEWLAHASRAKRRVPHRLLPGLFDYGTTTRAVRQPVADASDARGAWLMSLNPRWQYAAGEQADPRGVWDTGTPEQRVQALRQLRSIDPAGARELALTTWKQDGADERARFVESMRIGLSADDEAFLESALDDRSKQVRAAAADVLARLPQSAFVRRMIDRVTPLLKFTPGSSGGILRKAKPGTLDVTLPPEKFDEAWARDAITEKSEQRMGQRQWRLVQLLSNVPPTHWSQAWNAAPADVVAAAVASEHADNLLLAWTNAAVRHPDPAWSAALLRATVGKPDDGRLQPLRQELLRTMEPAQRLEIFAEVLEASGKSFDARAAWLGAADFPLDHRSASAATKAIEQRVAATKAYDYLVANVLEHLALVLPPDVHDTLVTRWTGDTGNGGWEPNRKALDRFFQTLSLRHDIQREFAK